MKNRMFKISLSFIPTLFALGFGQENYAQWARYQTIKVNTTSSGANIAVTQLNFPVLVRLNAGNFDFSKSASGGADIRFTKLDGRTRLKHQIERWDATSQVAEIWVLTDTVTGNGSSNFRLYSGKGGAPDSSSGSAVFTTRNGFQGVFHLGEATDDTARDATSNSLKGIPRNVGGKNPIDVPGLIGRAKNFLGNNSDNHGGSYRLVGSNGGDTYLGPLNFQNDSATLNGVPQYTLSAWIYTNEIPSGVNNRKAIIAKSRGISGSQYHLRLLEAIANQTDQNLDTNRVDFSDGPTAIYKIGTKGVTTGFWFHVVAIRSGPVGSPTNLQVYINGESFFSASNSITPSTRSDYNVYIGSFSNDSGFFNGKIDEATFSNVARDPDWIKLSYETQKPGSGCVRVDSAITQAPSPSNLIYSTNPAIYTVGKPIPLNTPSLTGVVSSLVNTLVGTIATYSVSPSLPAGLILNTATGVLSGTPITQIAANYTITATNAAGSISTLLYVAVIAPPAIVSQPASQVAPLGATVQFGIRAGDGTQSSLVYKWIKNHTDTLPGAITDTLTLTNVQRADSGATYQCLAQNMAGATLSQPATLLVNASTGILNASFLHPFGAGGFSLRFPAGWNTAEARISVEDVWGRTRLEKSFSVLNGFCDVSGPFAVIPPGVYFVNMHLLDAHLNRLATLRQKFTLAH